MLILQEDIFCYNKKHVVFYESKINEIKHFLSFSSVTNRLWPSHLTNWCSFPHLSENWRNN